jgi:hypothetical protein
LNCRNQKVSTWFFQEECLFVERERERERENNFSEPMKKFTNFFAFHNKKFRAGPCSL